MTLSVRPLAPVDYEALRDIRLEALRLHPEFFAADLAQEEAASREEWLARLSSAVTLGGFLDGRLCGLLVLARPSRPKLAHTGEVGAMYVREEARGTGLADALMHAAIDLASRQMEQLKLTVNAQNARAVRFYERHGFREIGRIPKSLFVDGRYYDELLMLRRVSPID
ncbi:MAG TPA: GNAT family N-acetyltransferase [Rhizomicrobium sp.]|nr:GNAT family N-acetyltransferase [Rhizomicrobium sp.]